MCYIYILMYNFFHRSIYLSSSAHDQIHSGRDVRRMSFQMKKKTRKKSTYSEIDVKKCKGGWGKGRVKLQ